MPTIRRLFRSIFVTIVISSLSLSAFQPRAVSAQGADGIERQVNPESGKVSFISPESGNTVPAARALGTSALPIDPAMALARRFAPEFGLNDPTRNLSVKQTESRDDGRIMARYQQNYQGIPVLGGELIVNTNENGDLYSINGEVSPNLTLSTQPAIDSEQAQQTALQALAKWYKQSVEDFSASEPELWIFDESLVRSSSRPTQLVWRLEITSTGNDLDVRELVLVNAQRGNISLHFNQIDTAWSSERQSTADQPERLANTAEANVTENHLLLTFSPLVSTYTANSTSSLPGSFLCNQADPTCSTGDSHAKAAHKYAIGTFNLYDTQHNRNSINNNGMTMISTVHYCEALECPYSNAFWSGTQMVYGDAFGFALADDVVGHELTHGVTQHESNLFYYYQSGAINESFSDLWGEYYDQTNSLGNDAAGVKWQIGEDVSGFGAFRSMSDPSSFADPDKMSSPNYFTGDDDNGGVHHNSALNNKAVYLMVDGGSFNGKTITALGWDKTAAIYYEVQTNLLLSGSDYSDLYYALQQACANLIGQKGITSANCLEVKDAIDAVEMNSQPIPGFNTDAPLCDNSNHVPFVSFSDDIEAGAGKWTFTSTPNALRWQVDSAFFGLYAQSGLHSLYGDDFPADVTDARARLAPFTVPSNAYLHFAQSYGFEYFELFSEYYDGGVLEYSTHGGSTWVDAGSLIEINGYDGTIYNGFANPLGGRSGFVGSSHGYISTRLNLASLAGQTVTFRWRMGLDEAISAWGWWVDNVKVYRCGPSNLDVHIGGSLMNHFYVATGSSIRQDFPGVDNGPARVLSTDGADILAAMRVIWKEPGLRTSYSEMMGLPKEQLSTEYWFPWYNNAVPVSMDQGLRIGNVNTTSTTIQVWVGNSLIDNFMLSPGASVRVGYPIDNGPMRVMCTDCTGNEKIIAAMRVIWKEPGSRFSYSEMMGLPKEQLSSEYWFPWYNNAVPASMDQGFRIGNVSSTEINTVEVRLGNSILDTITLGMGGSVRVAYNVDNGPIKIVCTTCTNTGNDKIIAALRVIWKEPGFRASYSEMMGLPTEQLSSQYWFPWYNNAVPASMDQGFRIANVSTTESNTVEVWVGSTRLATIPLGAGGSTRVGYNVDNGPIKIICTTCTNTGSDKILAALRVIWKEPGFRASYSEMMGLPHEALSTEYWFPWYNFAAPNSMDQGFRISVP